jgi:magnesium transporter
MLAKDIGLFQKIVQESCFPMIDMGNNGNISNLIWVHHKLNSLYHESISQITKNELYCRSLNGGTVEKETVHLDDFLKEQLDQVVHKQTSWVHLHELSKLASEHSPIDLAYAASSLPPTVRPTLYEHLPNREAKIKFVLNTDGDTRLALFRHLDDPELKTLFQSMPIDEAVWILEDMPERRFRRLMEQIDSKKAMRIRELRQHPRRSAGRLMSSDFFLFAMDKTVGEVAAYVRDNPRIDFMKGVFVTDQKGVLQGYVPARNLMINPDATSLRQVMRPILHKVSPEATREEVIELVERYKIFSLPVVDVNDRLVGVITNEDIIEAMEDQTDETIAHMTGTREKYEAHESVRKKVCARSPWLLATLLAGLVNVSVMASFQQKVGMLTFVIFFVPLIMGMSGNIGLQCSTVLVRHLALSGTCRRQICKELASGLCTGALFGTACAIIVTLVPTLVGGVSPIAAAAIVSIGLIGSCFSGTLLGVLSPLFFSRIGVDPAISSGPIVTAFNDFLSMSIYFLIAWGVSNLFF